MCVYNCKEYTCILYNLLMGYGGCKNVFWFW